MGLSLEALARDAATTPERVSRLVDAGIIVPAEDGSFSAGDVQRSKLVSAFEDVGITIDQLEWAVRERVADFSFIQLFYPPPGRRSDRTYLEFERSLGPRGHLLGPILAAMGIAEPGPGGSLTVDDERVLEAFLAAWDLGSDEVATRAARIVGDAIRRVAEGWVDLFYEQVSNPVQRRMLDAGMPVEAMIPEIVPAAGRVAELAPVVLDWLERRHIEQALHARNIESAEEQLTVLGMAPARPAQPPAIAFVDVSGFTRLTQARGDQEGARIAVRLGELAEQVARRHGGRLVKLLGDGALLRFDHPTRAVEAALDTIDEAPAYGLPPIHVGIHAGPIIDRDGDVFGHTVNVAARVGGVAGAGEVVVTSEVLNAAGDKASVEWEPIGQVELKGVDEKLDLSRAHRSRRS